MTSTETSFDWSTTNGQALLGLGACILVGAAAFVGGAPALLILLAVILLPTRILVLCFVCFSYSRIHEAYPFLVPLKLPLVFSVTSIAGIILIFLKNQQNSARGHSPWLAIAALTTFLAADINFLMGQVSANYAPRSLIAISMVLASVAFYAAYRTLDELNDVKWGYEMKLFVAFFITVTLTLVMAQNPGNSVDYWLSVFWKIGAMTLVLAWLLRSRQDFAAAIWMIVGSGCLIAFVTCYNWYYGIDLVEGTRVSIARTLFSTPEQIRDAIPGQAIEGGSLLGDPNDLALVLLFPVGLAVACVATMGWRTWLGRFCSFVLPLLTIAIIMTQSRGGALGIVAAFGAVGLFYVRSKVLLVTLAVVGVIGLATVMDIGSRSSGGLAEYEAEGIDRSALERLHAWSAAVSMTTSYPLTGVGLRNFPSQFRAHTPVWSGRNMAAHSTWFGVMAETGLVGITLLLALIGALLLAIRRTWLILESLNVDQIYKTFCIGMFAGIAGFCAAGTFLSQGFGWPLYLLVGFTAAISCAARQLEQKQLASASTNT